MKTITKKEIQDIAKIYYFGLDDEFLDVVYNDFCKFLNNIDVLNSINTDNVEQTDYCTTQSFNQLRKDEPEIVENPEEYTKNAKRQSQKYILVK